ncbi:YidC/Oxa1 family membrane protein insertase [Actinomadura rupiterrae]|uniref:YidC/Oxa1 family membrane protein insertase n=1 Tax=Actinomadura rupiterrae TaxID=559627 RepID=UPI0020A46A0F|nr:membrane protein insertase YidC [Actinomadura rupiterrae]MCP2335826.1 YidC/Oxa1 family membrane protein insertase [Actinomadura rupiterrae]
MGLLDAPVAGAYALVKGLTLGLEPVAGGFSAVLAIVLFTLGVRALMLPLAVRAARGEKARAALLPKLARLRERHGRNPERLRRETAALYEREGASPLTGFGPMLLQFPFFMVMYRLFRSGMIAGHQNVLLAHAVFSVPLGQNFVSVAATPAGLVFAGLFVALAVVGWWSSRHAPQAWMRLLSLGTVAVAAFVPLAAGVYLLASASWTAVERAVLRRTILTPAG